MKIALIFLIVFACLTSGALAYAAATIPLQEHLRIIEAWRAQIDLLKWVGGAMVAGLVSAVGILWAALNAQRKHQDGLSAEMREQLLKSSNEQTQSNTKLAASLDSLQHNCQERFNVRS